MDHFQESSSSVLFLLDLDIFFFQQIEICGKRNHTVKRNTETEQQGDPGQCGGQTPAR